MPVILVEMADRAVIKSMDITVAASQDFMEATARSVKIPRFASVCLWASIDINKTILTCRC